MFASLRTWLGVLLLVGVFGLSVAQAQTDPLLNAVLEGNLEEVQKLLKQGADIHAQDLKSGWTPLHWAALGGSRDVVAFLIEHGANIKAKNKSGETPLHEAAHYGHRDVVALLIKRGADARAQDAKGFTPLQRAALMGHMDVVELLKVFTKQ